MENMGIQFVTYSAFTEATRQVKQASAELQRSFVQERQRTQEKTKAAKSSTRARQGVASGK